jgi:2-dehydro-3-deoxyphosphooctonate aldolase (KDO 8-P synthase)
MKIYSDPVFLSQDIKVDGQKPVLFAGPCVIESEDLCDEVAETMKTISAELGFQYVFKASFDKANRTSGTSFRSIGLDESLIILDGIRNRYQLPVVSDIHESYQAAEVAQVVDVLQIPAFLCRQTDLLEAAGRTGRAVNIKKGQFMDPEGMQYAVNKVKATGNPNVTLTERGVSFGYQNLVVDFRSLPVMRQYAPVIFDVTHSVQQPGGAGGSSGGQRQFTTYLAKAAAAAGVDGFFIETHPDPQNAMSDGPNMIPLNDMRNFLQMLLEIWTASKKSEIYSPSY